MKLLLDIEVYPNLFYVGIKNYETKESTAFEVSEHIDQRSEIYEFLNSCEKHKDFIITFNGIDYDMIVLGYFYNQYYKLLSLSPEQCCSKLKNLSDQLIENDDFEIRNMYKYVFKRIINIDLYKYWAKLLRLSKKLSLKSLGIQLNYHTVQELPYNPSTYLTYEEGLEVKHYCSVHDIGILELLTDKMRDEINLRKTIVQDYDIPAWSMDAPKIASEALLKDYCNITGQNTKDVSKMRFNRPTIKFGELLKDILVKYTNQEIIRVYDKWISSIDTFSESFILFNSNDQGVEISASIGGIHSVNNNEIHESNEEYVIITSDVSALYPSLLINYKGFRFPELVNQYATLRQDRLEAKRTGNKKRDAFLKLCINSCTGLIDMEHSWLYYPEGIMKVRCAGQLILLELIDNVLSADYQLISVNTDGAEIKLKRSQLSEYYDLVKTIEEKHNIVFEHDFYKKIIYQNVNSYLAITESGKIKEKGEFVRKPELGNSTDFLIIPHLLHDYFVLGIQPEDAIKNYTDIFLFCASKKVDKSYSVEWSGIKQQRLNRYYVSKKGGFLYKCRNGSKNHMLKQGAVQIYNKHEFKDITQYDINYSYYITEVRKKIHNLEYKQNSLF